MFEDVILFGNIALYAATLVLLMVGHHKEDQGEADAWAHRAAIAATVASGLTIATNLIVIFGPDIFVLNWDWVVLLLLAVTAPIVALVGAILTFFDRAGGVRTLVTGTILWLLICVLGFIV